MAEVEDDELREVDWEKQRWAGARQRGASESIDTAVQMRLDAIVRRTDLTGEIQESEWEKDGRGVTLTIKARSSMLLPGDTGGPRTAARTGHPSNRKFGVNA
jgi:hypothetical protein